MALTYFKYFGPPVAYSHPEGEVNLIRFDVQNHLSPRGLRFKATHTMHIGGDLLADTQAALLTRIGEIIDTYSYDDGDAILYGNDGTATPYAMYTDGGTNLTGVRVIQKSWPKGGREELVTARKFSVTLQTEYEEVDDQLLQFRESLRYIGNCGPRIWPVDLDVGAPVLQIINQQTHQRIIQQGRAIGWAGYPVYPDPIFSSPVLEHQDQREVELHGPQFMGKLFRGYEISWRYIFSAASAQVAAPNYQ